MTYKSSERCKYCKETAKSVLFSMYLDRYGLCPSCDSIKLGDDKVIEKIKMLDKNNIRTVEHM